MARIRQIARIRTQLDRRFSPPFRGIRRIRTTNAQSLRMARKFLQHVLAQPTDDVFRPGILAFGRNIRRKRQLWGSHVPTPSRRPSGIRRTTSAHRTPQARVDSARTGCSEGFLRAPNSPSLKADSSSGFRHSFGIRHWVAGGARAGQSVLQPKTGTRIARIRRITRIHLQSSPSARRRTVPALNSPR